MSDSPKSRLAEATKELDILILWDIDDFFLRSFIR